MVYFAGYDQSVFSGVVGNQHFLDATHHPSDSRMEVLVGVCTLGRYAGCILNVLVEEYFE